MWNTWTEHRNTFGINVMRHIKRIFCIFVFPSSWYSSYTQCTHTHTPRFALLCFRCRCRMRMTDISLSATYKVHTSIACWNLLKPLKWIYYIFVVTRATEIWISAIWYYNTICMDYGYYYNGSSFTWYVWSFLIGFRVFLSIHSKLSVPKFVSCNFLYFFVVATIAVVVVGCRR